MLSAGPVCSCAHSLCTLHTRPRVQRAPGLPCALCLERAGASWKTSGVTRREIAKLYPPSLRGALATKQSILSLRGDMDCFASLAMTVWLLGLPSIPETRMMEETRVIESRSRGVLDAPPEPVIGLAGGETRWRGMTVGENPL